MKAMRSRRWVMVFRFSAIAVFIAASSALVTYYACNMSHPGWESVFRDKREELEKFASDVASGCRVASARHSTLEWRRRESRTSRRLASPRRAAG
jgi:hypothetical protein